MQTTKIKLVLLSCCAPCSCGAIRQVLDNMFVIPAQAGTDISDFIVLFYNPNIYPQSEYQKRLAEQVKYCESLGVKYAIGNYNHEDWLNAVRGLENEPERGRRCSACFRHRFKFAQDWAIQHGYNAIASALGVSKHKDQAQVDMAAHDAITKINYLPVIWDDDLRQEINKKTGFYRQNYCGCEFSIRK